MKRYPIPLVYTWNVKIASYDVGKDRRLKLSSQLRLQQEGGELQFEEGGLGFDQLIKQGITFVITRANSRIYRSPKLNEQVELVTWHRNSKGAQFYRCYQFLDKQGRPLIESVSAFVMIDPKTHKIIRPTVFSQFAVTQQPERLNNCPDPGKLILPDLKESGRRQVRWSDIDYNGHLNNAIYADIVSDVMPKDIRDREFTGFSFVYLHEALEGESITLKTGITHHEGANKFWVAGDHARGHCFEACVQFKSE